MELRFQGLGFGFRIWDLGHMIVGFRVQDIVGFRIQGSGFRVQSSGFRVQGSGFRVQGSGFKIQGSGFGVKLRVKGLGSSV